MNERDELEARIEQAACAERLQAQGVDPYLTVDFQDGIERAARIAVAMLAPRTIITMEELNALPIGSVFRDPDGSVGELADGYTWDVPRVILWCGSDLPDIPDPSLNLPATVLYIPEEA